MSNAVIAGSLMVGAPRSSDDRRTAVVSVLFGFGVIILMGSALLFTNNGFASDFKHDVPRRSVW